MYLVCWSAVSSARGSGLLSGVGASMGVLRGSETAGGSEVDIVWFVCGIEVEYLDWGVSEGECH